MPTPFMSDVWGAPTAIRYDEPHVLKAAKSPTNAPRVREETVDARWERFRRSGWGLVEDPKPAKKKTTAKKPAPKQAPKKKPAKKVPEKQKTAYDRLMGEDEY